MSAALTHASFFSGVGGFDLGIERAGWRTVSFSEIEPYAAAVLAERWPRVPNLGCIKTVAGYRGEHGHYFGDKRRDACDPDDLVRLDRVERLGPDGRGGPPGEGPAGRRDPEGLRIDGGVAEPRDRGGEPAAPGREWTRATLWSGGFPCQDLSLAGRRRGLAGSRSGLAFAFLDLVERHRPPAVLLENVPGLFSSHGGRDLGALVRRMAELGYVGSARVLDARHFGVPQRRRRVFIVALDARRGFGADRAGQVLSVGTRCRRHPPTGGEARTNAADGLAAGAARSLSTSQRRLDGDTESFIVGPLDTGLGHHGGGWPDQSVDAGHVVVGSPSDAARVREADGLAGRLDDRRELADPVLAPTLRVGPGRVAEGGPGETVPVIVSALDSRDRGAGADDNDAQARHLVVGGNVVDLDAYRLLPPGLDSNRYRCCGNGVVSDVAEFVGLGLRRVVEEVLS